MAELIKKAARGDDDVQHYHRAVVMAVDHDGGMLQNDDGQGGITVTDRNGKERKFSAVTGPPNPRGSIKARVITNGLDRLLEDDDLRVFWPMLPPDQIGIPVSPGEHVYVIFEGAGYDHGMWLSRVAGHDSANSYAGVESYVAPSAPKTAMDSFEPNDAEYPKTDEYSALSPTSNPNDLFDSGED